MQISPPNTVLVRAGTPDLEQDLSPWHLPRRRLTAAGDFFQPNSESNYTVLYYHSTSTGIQRYSSRTIPEVDDLTDVMTPSAPSGISCEGRNETREEKCVLGSLNMGESFKKSR